jgi:hypothetical protein
MQFLFDEVGLDGVYMDMFVPSVAMYGTWDGRHATLDKRTGCIVEKFANLALLGAQARRKLVEYALSRGKIVITNGHAVSCELQTLPAFRFIEGQHFLDLPYLRTSGKPALNEALCKGQLASPISLGYSTNRYGDYGEQNAARIVMGHVIAYLRHGLLYYGHNTDIPQDGPGAGEYGPINHMFPITPVRLFEGGIVGKERIITCVSGTYELQKPDKPRILTFDRSGREKDSDATLRQTASGWAVDVRLDDWNGIAVIETEETNDD